MAYLFICNTVAVGYKDKYFIRGMKHEVIVGVGDGVSVGGGPLLVPEVQVPVHPDTQDSPVTQSSNKQILVPRLPIL